MVDIIKATIIRNLFFKLALSNTSLNNPTINLGVISSNYIRITGKVNRQSENTTYTNNIVTHTTSESNYIDQITVASSPGSDQHTLYIIT